MNAAEPAILSFFSFITSENSSLGLKFCYFLSITYIVGADYVLSMLCWWAEVRGKKKYSSKIKKNNGFFLTHRKSLL